MASQGSSHPKGPPGARKARHAAPVFASVAIQVRDLKSAFGEPERLVASRVAGEAVTWALRSRAGPGVLHGLHHLHVS